MNLKPMWLLFLSEEEEATHDYIVSSIHEAISGLRFAHSPTELPPKSDRVLLSNAVKEGNRSPTPRTWAAVQATFQALGACVTVYNDGTAGFPPDWTGWVYVKTLNPY